MSNPSHFRFTHTSRYLNQSGLTNLESLVLLALSIALLWLFIPVVLVNIGWTKAPEVSRNQPILTQKPTSLLKEVEDEALKLKPIETYLETPTLPESLEKITQGKSPLSPTKPNSARE
jgi:hypothetical protein